MASPVNNVSRNIIDVFLKIIQALECPVCYEFVDAPIWQCDAGHIICSNCKHTLQHCPTCRRPFSEVRARNVEQISDVMLFPCKNDGCEYMFSLAELRRHEDRCAQATASSRPDHFMRSATLQYNILKYIERDIAPFFITKKDTKEQATQTDEEMKIRTTKNVSGLSTTIGCSTPAEKDTLINCKTSLPLKNNRTFLFPSKQEFGPSRKLLTSSSPVVGNVSITEPSSKFSFKIGNSRIGESSACNEKVFQFHASHENIQKAPSTSKSIAVIRSNLTKKKSTNATTQINQSISDLHNLPNHLKFGDISFDDNGKGTLESFAQKALSYFQNGKIAFTNTFSPETLSMGSSSTSSDLVRSSSSSSSSSFATQISATETLNSSVDSAMHIPTSNVIPLEACASNCSDPSMNVNSNNGLIQASGIVNQPDCNNYLLDTSCKSTSSHKGCVISPIVINSSQKGILTFNDSEKTISPSSSNLASTSGNIPKSSSVSNELHICRCSFPCLPNNNSLNVNITPLSTSNSQNSYQSGIANKPNIIFNSTMNNNPGTSFDAISSPFQSYNNLLNNLSNPLNSFVPRKSVFNLNLIPKSGAANTLCSSNSGLLFNACSLKPISKLDNLTEIRTSSQELFNDSPLLDDTVNAVGSESLVSRDTIGRTQVFSTRIESDKKVYSITNANNREDTSARTPISNPEISPEERTPSQESFNDSLLLGATLNFIGLENCASLQDPKQSSEVLSTGIKNYEKMVDSITNKYRDITITHRSGFNSIWPDSSHNICRTLSNPVFGCNDKPLFTVGCGNKLTSVYKKGKSKRFKNQ